MKLILITLLIIPCFLFGQDLRTQVKPAELIINTWICCDAKYDTSDKDQYEKVKIAFNGKAIQMDNYKLLSNSKDIDVLVFKKDGILLESDKFSKNTKKEYKISPAGDKIMYYRADGSFDKMDVSKVLKLTPDSLVLYSGIVKKTFIAFK